MGTGYSAAVMEIVCFLCFFLSGASGLLFEVVWTRQLQLVFGSTTLAMSTVLAVFMGGLALGSALGGKIAARSRHPLALYALLEAGVGLYALAFPHFLAGYPALHGFLWRTFGAHFALLSVLRFLATAAVLIVPTTLMGATLPLLSQYVAQRRSGLLGATVSVGTLFAMNTAGAVLGTFLSGFVLLPRLGVTHTNWIGAGTNLSLAAALFLLGAFSVPPQAKGPSGPTGPLPGTDNPPDAKEPLFSPRVRRLAVISYAVSGATAMVYQVLWTRALAIVIGSSVYSFTLILLAFLLGLSSGAALVVRFLPTIFRPVRALGALHALTFLSVGCSYLLLDKLPGLFLSFLRAEHLGVEQLLLTQFGLAALAIMPATFVMGGVMPLTIRIFAGDLARTGRDVGVAYALNTLGAIVGSFAAGFVVVPSLGLQRGLLAGAVVSAGLAALLLWFSEASLSEPEREPEPEPEPGPEPKPGLGLGPGPAVSRRTGARVFGCAVLAAALLFAVFSRRWNLTHFAAGLFRVSVARSVVRLHDRVLPDLLFYRDGIATTVSVERWGKTIALKNNGKVDASNSDDMGTQIMVGLLPLLLHKTALDKPPRVAVVGYGSGVTVGAVTQFPIAQADVVELEPAVVEAGDRFFADVNHLPSRNPRVRVIIGDGRNFLDQATGPDDRYDVIISEPSNPWITGVSNLFTIDYWKQARKRLADDGVFCQWAQLYELSPVNIKTLLRSFATVFPNTYVFTSEYGSGDMILVATQRPLPLDLARLRRNFSVPPLRAELSAAGFGRAEEIVADLLLTPDEIWAFTVGGQLNTDDNARIEFAAPRDLLNYLRHESSVPRVHSDDWIYGQFERYLVGHGLPFDQVPAGFVDETGGLRRAEVYASLGRALLSRGRQKAAARLLRRSRGCGGGKEADALATLLALFAKDRENDRQTPFHPAGDDPASRDDSDNRFVKSLGMPAMPTGLSPQQERRILAEWDAARRHLARRQYVPALRQLRDWPMKWIEQMGPNVRLLLGYLLYKTDLKPEALDHLAELSDNEAFLREHPSAHYYLALVQMASGKPRQAVASMEHYVKKSGIDKKL